MKPDNVKISWLFLLLILFCSVVQGDDICPICHDEIGATNDIIVLCCQHRFHKSCLYKWANIKSTCPVCKKSTFAHRDSFVFAEHDLCSRLMFEGLKIDSPLVSGEVVRSVLQFALEDMAALEYQQFLIAEEIEKQKQAKIRAQQEEKERRKKELEQEIMCLCQMLEGLSIDDDEYDYPPSMNIDE